MSSLKARLAAGVLALNAGAWLTYCVVGDEPTEEKEEEVVKVIEDVATLPVLEKPAIPLLDSSISGSSSNPRKSSETSANNTESDCNCKGNNVTNNIVVTSPYVVSTKPTGNLLTVSNAPTGTTVTEQKISSSSPATTIRFLVGSQELSSGPKGEKDKSTSDSSKPQPQVEVGRSDSLSSILEPTNENQESRTIQPHSSSSSVLSGQGPQDTDLLVEQIPDLKVEVMQGDEGIESLPEADGMGVDEGKIDIRAALESINFDKLAWGTSNYYLPRHKPINEDNDSGVANQGGSGSELQTNAKEEANIGTGEASWSDTLSGHYENYFKGQHWFSCCFW